MKFLTPPKKYIAKSRIVNAEPLLKLQAQIGVSRNFIPYPTDKLHYTYAYLGTDSAIPELPVRHGAKAPFDHIQMVFDIALSLHGPLGSNEHIEIPVITESPLVIVADNLIALHLTEHSEVRHETQLLHDNVLALFTYFGISNVDAHKILLGSSELQYFADLDQKIHHITLGILSEDLTVPPVPSELIPSFVTILPPTFSIFNE